MAAALSDYLSDDDKYLVFQYNRDGSIRYLKDKEDADVQAVQELKIKRYGDGRKSYTNQQSRGRLVMTNNVGLMKTKTKRKIKKDMQQGMKQKSKRKKWVNISMDRATFKYYEILHKYDVISII